MDTGTAGLEHFAILILCKICKWQHSHSEAAAETAEALKEALVTAAGNFPAPGCGNIIMLHCYFSP